MWNVRKHETKTAIAIRQKVGMKLNKVNWFLEFSSRRVTSRLVLVSKFTHTHTEKPRYLIGIFSILTFQWHTKSIKHFHHEYSNCSCTGIKREKIPTIFLPPHYTIIGIEFFTFYSNEKVLFSFKAEQFQNSCTHKTETKNDLQTILYRNWAK